MSESAWTPLRTPLFRAVWTATLFSNIGTWMHDVGAGWLMASLTNSPTMVALVQTAITLPVFFLALPAGAMADMFDRRRQLMTMQIFLAVTATILALLTFLQVMTPTLLLALTFCMGIGTAGMLPAWSAIVPDLVERRDLPAAIALNSMGINVARAIGPACAGFLVSEIGIWFVFALNAVSFTGVLTVLYRWQYQPPASIAPGERLLEALRAGVRFAARSPELRVVLLRGLGFFLFASASWALLPLVAKLQLQGSAETFGLLVGSIGAGAVAGAVLLARLRQQLAPSTLVTGATVLYACCLLALPHLRWLPGLMLLMALSGMAWISVLSTMQIAAQSALPNWVRSRGLAIFMAVFMGSMALGSICWGRLAEWQGIPMSLSVAGAGALSVAVLLHNWRIVIADSMDFAPTLHWPTPPQVDAPGRGPVMISIEYQVQSEKQEEFQQLIRELGLLRRRDGSFGWSIFGDAEQSDCYVEIFYDESWQAHLRLHERVAADVKQLQARIDTCLQPGSGAVVRHFVTPGK